MVAEKALFLLILAIALFMEFYAFSNGDKIYGAVFTVCVLIVIVFIIALEWYTESTAKTTEEDN